jgi:hypothetical protein
MKVSKGPKITSVQKVVDSKRRAKTVDKTQPELMPGVSLTEN